MAIWPGRFAAGRQAAVRDIGKAPFAHRDSLSYCSRMLGFTRRSSRIVCIFIQGASEMRKKKYLIAIAALLLSTNLFAHTKIDPLAPLFGNYAAGNGGLAWFTQFFFFL
jgi:hypothetical protein